MAQITAITHRYITKDLIVIKKPRPKTSLIEKIKKYQALRKLTTECGNDLLNYFGIS
jgi:hypothetical protein